MARLGPSRGSKAAAVALLSVGLLGVGLLVSVAQTSSEYLAPGAAGGRPGALSPRELRSRVLQEPRLQRTLYELARSAESLSAFGAALQERGLVLGSGGGSGALVPHGQQGPGGKAGSSSIGGSATKPGIPRLTRELALAHARGNVVVVTWANWHFYDFALNWARNLRQQGIHNFLVGAMDLQTAEALAARDVPVFAMFAEEEDSTGLTTGDFVWGSPTFFKMGRQKVQLARAFLGFGLDLCLCDVDTVWINDPTPYFERYPEADMLASSDQLHSTIEPGDEGLEVPEAIHSALNIGLLFFRHSANTTAFLDRWAAMLERDAKVWDQNAFNWAVKDGLVPFRHHPSDPRLVWGANQSVVVGVLPIASFTSGHTFFVQQLFQVQKVQPYVVHTTFQYGGSMGKRHRMREALLWVDEPAYHSEGRFLSVELEAPATPPAFEDWADERMIRFHLDAMRRQLRQLRAAFGLAVALNRTLIMPKLTCWCDRYWGPVERCRLPGARQTRLPFVCPMDHILEPFHFANNPGPAGPPIRFREYSFLENDRTPKALKEGQVTLIPQTGATGGELEAGGKQLTYPAGSAAGALRDLLAPVQDAPLLHATALRQAFGGFEEPGEREAFQRRVRSIPGFWCCRKVPDGVGGGQPYVELMFGEGG